MKSSPARRGYFGAIALAWLLVGAAHAADLVQVREPWAKATVPGQKVGGVYMKIVARENLHLTGAKSAVAETAEVHQMKMENGMMRMRAVPSLELPAGKTVKLEPGGYHIMLFDLRQSLVAGQKLKLELTVEDASKRPHRVAVEVVVRDRDAGPPDGHDHH
ncbi:MAG: copper chaperone PCu(A)C [Betaproteobacteria bacterium]|nr:copper chaperone PCu(A)C [Betaproteobacteria bacterium]